MTHKGGNFEIVRASAGSGKTFRLVLMYLECALKEPNPRYFSRILALTFTNKAAAEMKSRILEDLDGLVVGESDKMELLSKSLGLKSSEIQKRATLLHKEMLHRYSDISVMTIDKFVNKLVKSFARDLALEQDYRIEIDSNKVLEDAVSQLLDKLGTPGNSELTALLKSFALNKVDDDQDSSVRRPLTQLGKTLIQENMRDVIDVLSDIDPAQFKKISDDLRRAIKKSEDQFFAIVDKALNELKVASIDNYLPQRGSIKKILTDLRWVEIADPTKTFKNIINDPHKMVLASSPTAIKDKTESLHPFLEKVYNKLLDIRPISTKGKNHFLSQKLNNRIALMGTLAALHQEIEKVQIDNNIRTFHAMHERISDIVSNNPAPFIYEKLGERYNHIFMDEFQDTSITQWHNLVVLYHHSISNDNRTLVVGDGKQAIYRFRNGDYKQLMDLPNLQPGDLGEALKDAENSFNLANNPSSLDHNFRSGRKIVEWNNDLFEAMSKVISPELKDVYSGLKQTPKTNFNGGVYLDFAVEKTKDLRRGIYTDLIVKRIKYYKSLKYKLGDITILVRDNETGSKLAQDLLANGITPSTEESLQLGRHPGPLAVVAFMRWLLRPLDYRQSAIILQCACAMSQDSDPIDESEILEKFVIITEGKKAVFETDKMLKMLFPDLSFSTSGPLASFIGQVCNAMGITEKYPAYTEALMELAHKVNSTDESGIHGFLRVWDQKGKEESIATGKSKKAVQIMTVHKAKGLAFKIVISLISTRNFKNFSGVIPVDLSVGNDMPISAAMLENSDMKDTILEGQRQEELNRVLLDNINVTYVALTRPVERLDVILELEKFDFDQPSNMSELIVWSLEKVYNSKVLPGDQTTEFSAQKVKIRQEDSVELRFPKGIITGEKIDQLVVVPDSEEDSSQPSKMSPMEIGSEVHRILESVSSEEVWPEIKQNVKRGMTMGESDANLILERVESVIKGEETKKYFERGLHVEMEQSFVSAMGEILRPDRIVCKENFWTVIDFKSSEKRLEDHKIQVQQYCEILSEIEGQNVEGILIYTDPLKVLKVV